MDDRSSDTPAVAVLVAARNEGERIVATLAALARAFPRATVWVADDGSSDDTAAIARAAGARVARCERHLGKGGAMSAAAREMLAQGEEIAVVVLCDADLEDSAERLRELAQPVERGEAELAVAVFSRSRGGGFGLAQGFARWAVRRRCGLRMRAPICGQRALTPDALAKVLPFANGYGMEMGITIDAVRAGLTVGEVELELTHRAHGRTPAGFAHRARQLLDFVAAYRDRGRGRPRARAVGRSASGP